MTTYKINFPIFNRSFKLEIPDLSDNWPQPQLKAKMPTVDTFKEDPIRFVHAHAQGAGGITIAYRKLSPYNSGHMVELAVAMCNPKDTFVKKVGKQLAEERFKNGNTITIPIYNDDIPYALRMKFWYDNH